MGYKTEKDESQKPSAFLLILCGLWELWRGCNSIVIDHKNIIKHICISEVRKWIIKVNFIFKGTIDNNVTDMLLLKFFSINASGGVKLVEVH